MKFKSTIHQWSVLLVLNLYMIADLNASQAVYCSPTFSNGCFTWNNQSIILDSINWTLGSTACTVSDYTILSTTLTAGTAYPMSVANGSWCGCAVWIDFNNDQVFDTLENLYYKYANVAAQDTYNFNITIPLTVNTGSYRMRVLAGWGTDCYSVSANGYGPCGSYQYGNFDDFTVNVINTPAGVNNISDNSFATFSVFPNPAVSSATVLIHKYTGNESHLQLLDITGNIIRSIPVKHDKVEIDINELSKGVYILRYVDGNNSQSIRLVK